MTPVFNAQTRCGRPARGKRAVLLGSVAVVIGVLGSSGAYAQCTDNFNFVGNLGGGVFTPVQNLFPLGTGSSLSALTSTINTVNTAFLTSTSAFVSAPSSPQPNQQGGGAWGRVIAGTVDSTNSSTGTLDLTALGFVATGRQNCKTTTRQDYTGFQVGHDFSILNGGGTGQNWHWGVTAGFIDAKTTDITSAGTYTTGAFTFNTPEGSFSGTSQVPFAGIYTAYTKGSLFADAQVRWDFYQNSLSDRNNGMFNQRLDARGISVTGNVGYNIALHNNWFVEPSGGVVWSRVQIDPLSVSGLITGGGFAFARGVVTVDDIDSVLGRATVRVGTTFSTGQVTWQPYFTASVFHEFAGDVTARSLLANADPAINGAFLTTRSDGGVGTYGQFALGTAAVLGNSGWLGYARVDYRVGDVIEGVGINAGMRYQFSLEKGGSVKDAPAPIATYNWTGPYIGVFAGSTWGDTRGTFQPPGPPSAFQPDFAGYIGGGQVGYNLQTGHWVVGVEADYGLTNAHGGVACPFAVQFTCKADLDQLALFTGRLGTTWGRALFYVKGGLALGEVSASAFNNATSTGGVGSETTKWSTGWALGGGMEFALAQRWSAKAEYIHYDLGSETYQVSSLPDVVKADTKGETVRIGVNYQLHKTETGPIK
jgi:opacity protein-like surface antigen